MGATSNDLHDGWREAALRADAALAVSDAIADFPQTVRLPARDFELTVVRHFLSADECAGFIAMIDANRIPSPIVGDEPASAYRTSETCHFDCSHPAVAVVEARLHTLTGIDPVYGEALQGQRYGSGQEFKPHHDYFATAQPYWREQVLMGGQRTWTAMLFLNQADAGGHTKFPTAGIEIAPRAGNLLIWNNMDAFGLPNPASLHQGLPVASGVKYVLTKWYRERPWCR